MTTTTDETVTAAPDGRAPVVHELKTWQSYFHALATGEKNFEIRRADRDFRKGDKLWLREIDYGSGAYTGRDMFRTITYVLKHEPEFGLMDGFAILSLEPLSTTGAASSTTTDEAVNVAADAILTVTPEIWRVPLERHEAEEIARAVLGALAAAPTPLAAPSTGTEALPDERAAFEAWSDTKFVGRAADSRIGDNNYSVATISAAWLAWQARARLSVSLMRIAPLTDDDLRSLLAQELEAAEEPFYTELVLGPPEQLAGSSIRRLLAAAISAMRRVRETPPRSHVPGTGHGASSTAFDDQDAPEPPA